MKSIKLLLFASLLLCFPCIGQAAATQDGEIKRLEDILDKRIGIETGSAQDLELSKQYPQANLVRLNTVPELIAAQENGNIDYFYIDSIIALGTNLKERGIQWYFSQEGPGESVAIALRPADTKLCEELDLFLSRCFIDSTFVRLEEKWCTPAAHESDMDEYPLTEGGEKLVVGTTNNFPFSFIKDGVWTGFEIEMLTKFASESGRNIEFVGLNIAALIPALVTERIDMISAFIFITEERSKQVLFTIPYFSCKSACFGSDTEKIEEDATATNGKSKEFFSDLKERFYNNVIVEKRWKLILNGLLETVIISIFSILFGTIVGGGICKVLMSKNKLICGCGRVFTKAITGIPILVFLMILFYIIFAGSGISARWVSIIAFSLYFGAGTSEIFYTGFRSIDKGQTEAGLALGFTPFQTNIHFILPQAIKKISALYKGEVSSLVKNTSVVGYIAVDDLTKISDIIRSRTFDAFFPLIIISILYFLLAWLLVRLVDRILGK